ncbi:hypothetical protein [Microbulbifer epialgicus]|uniref:Uncharacterized protein n=1 Tax=Microbulbifer epialgicus TaxID=393907 RepID=A0ABV4NUS7_9GAMM
MKFTVEQYDTAISALQEAKKQLIEGTQDKGCGICGDCCHPDSCGHNPLYAQYLCNLVSDQSKELHNTLHYLGGFDRFMGESVGVARVIKP